MSNFSFSVSKDFATLANIAILFNSITSNISVPLQTINPYGDAIEIIFTNELNDEQKVILNTLVTQWDNLTPITYNQIVPISLKANGISNTIYKRYGVYGYLGSKYIGEIKKISIVSYMDNATNYSVRIYDVTNSKIIVESVFTNKTEMMLDMGQLSNIPETASVIEIQIKKTGGTANDKVYSEVIMFYS
ncbi:hypothetical protein QKU48_gp0984 [Fadolivirus algeromassiliense]|jgi:hypothetical protein|uniref:Uncharacterized protein n=1 Tax=Fadolivirus FV1/VV64 TaxID=3070911 RepID=A0A7D3R1E8_9VIRU|nr:hypothetical protein QKU48_gp0984 [Fadolivirus algeromassiliense]QKF94442.1 hypothetical protein Fadolivirus_1_984 [Fadolivirus FV1/VV64]